MIREALEYIIGLKAPSLLEFEGRKFIADKYHPVKPPPFQSLNFSSLRSLVEYVNEGVDDAQEPFNIIVDSETEVSILSDIILPENARNLYARAEAIVPKIQWESFQTIENTIIMLMSKFEDNADRAYLIGMLSGMTADTGVSATDDGMSQKVTMKKGISFVAQQQIRPIVKLKPYRTFSEVDQPEGLFLVRVKQNGSDMTVALFEADGGRWRINARENIFDFLQGEIMGEVAMRLMR